MKKTLIIGANGQLGKALRDHYPHATALTRDALDVSDEEMVASFDWSDVDIVLNAAAYVNADLSETEEKRATTWNANAIGPRNLAQAAQKHGFTLVHYSSEYVFDGTIENHDELESLSPLSVYGQSKAAGDLAVSAIDKHYILRITWVVGDGHNFVKTMANLAGLRIDPKVVDDQFGRLTFTSEIVRATEHLLKTNAEYGVYNVSNDGKIKSWAQIAADTFEYAGYDPKRVTFISTTEYSADKPVFAPRPVHSDLNLTKLRQTGFVSSDYEPLLKEYVASIGIGRTG